jgi:PAS domain S-box-containing protein
VYCSPGAARASGLDRESVPGRIFWKLANKEAERQRLRRAFRTTVEGGAAPPVTIDWTLDSGGAHALTWDHTLLSIEDAPPLVLCTGVRADRHPSWVTSASLGNADPMLSGIVEIASDGIISIDEDQRITLFNRGAESIFGYAQEEVLGRPLDMLIPPRNRDAHRAHVIDFATGAVQARRMAERQAILGLRRDGEEFPAEASISRIEVDGRLIFTVIIRDVTEAVRARESERFLSEASEVLASSLDFEQTLSNIAELTVRSLADFCAVDLLEESGEIRRLEVAYRTPRLEAAARLLERMKLDRRQRHLTSRVLQTGQSYLRSEVSDEHLLEVAQSTEHVEVLRGLEAKSYMVVPLRARGQLLGVLLMIASQESRAFTSEDVEIAEELGLRAGLAVDNARHYRQATRAVRARDETLGVVSHDLGNPLQAISIALEAIERRGGERPSSSMDRYILAIRQSADLMRRLIRDLLEVRRMEEGHLVLSRRPERFEGIIADSAAAIAPLALAKDVKIATHLPEGELPPVPMDADRILQVLSNLLGNAVKHSPSGSAVRIGVAVAAGELKVSVEDEGPGIPEAERPRIFDRFWRSETAPARGIGLGLAIAKGFVEGHGGRIWLESEVGSGSTFFFSLPLSPQGSRRERDPESTPLSPVLRSD